MASRRVVHSLFNTCRRSPPAPSSHRHRHHRAVCQALRASLGLQSFSTESSPTSRRRRRRPSGQSNDVDASNTAAPLTNSDISSPSSPFTPLDPRTNTPLTSDEYLSLASLSPWVPCPDVVIKRLFEIAEASSSDTHVDLGCGDGRLNFAAVNFPHYVKNSVGIDVDDSVLERARNRMKKRFVPTWNEVGASLEGQKIKGEMERLEFLQGDLIEVVERQKNMHQDRLREALGSSTGATDETADMDRDWSKADVLTTKISSSTIITMYFVTPALKQLKPFLASVFGGKDVRVITIGYQMEGWEPDWAERVLDLTVFRYDMKMIENDPEEWRLDYKDEVANAASTSNKVPTAQQQEEESIIQQQKQQRELNLLNTTLRIHHDQELDDFASFRLKRKSLEQDNHQHDPEDFEMAWDFDEEEDVQEIIRREEERRKEERGMGRRSLLAGLDMGEEKKGGSGSRSGRPVWRKPE